MSWLRLLGSGGGELNLSTTLNCGQAFRWQYDESKNEWFGVLFNYFIRFRQPSPECEVTFLAARTGASKVSTTPQDLVPLLRDYFQLQTPLTSVIGQWNCSYVKSAAQSLPGLRILRQEPLECLMAFICSSANNIPRISQLVDKMCQRYGEVVYKEPVAAGKVYHAFPEVAALVGDKVETVLQELKFGYRAKFIADTAKMLQKKGGVSWLYDLRGKNYATTHAALTELSGVGPKVADCVCLYSLDKPEAVPIDTHVLQVARRCYGDQLPSLKGKSVPRGQYMQIGDALRKVWSPQAGWAQVFMFTSDLKKFQSGDNTSLLPFVEHYFNHAPWKTNCFRVLWCQKYLL